MHALSIFALWFLLCVNLGRFQELFLFLTPLKLGKVSLALGLGLVAAKNIQDITLFLTKSAVKNYIWIIIAVAALGLPFSVYKSKALESFIEYLQLILAVSIIIPLARDHVDSMRDCFVVILLVLSIQMLLQKTAGRVSVSATYDPNDIALVCSVLLPLAVINIGHNNFIMKIISLMATGGGVASIALSGSRGGFLALVGITLYTIILAKKTRMLIITLALVGGAIFVAMAGDSLWERMRAIVDGTDYNLSQGGTGRMAIWAGAVEVMLRRPIFGVGIGQIVTGIATLSDTPWKTAHNSFLQIGVELGFAGLFALLAMLYFLYRTSKEGSEATFLSTQERNNYLALRVSTLGYCIGGFFLSHAYSPVLYTLVCYGVAMSWNLEKKEMQANTYTAYNHISKSPAPSLLEPTAKNSPPAAPKEHFVNAASKRASKQSRLAMGDNLHKKRTSS